MRPTGERGSDKGGDTPCHKLLGTALRVLNALCVEQRQPDQADEAYLRKAAGDKTAPVDQLARQIIQSEVDRLPQFKLTPRETEVLKLTVSGNSSKQIAGKLGVSFKTVVSHRSRIMAKLDIHDVASLVRYAIRQKLIEP